MNQTENMELQSINVQLARITNEIASIKRTLGNVYQQEIPAYVNLDQAVALKGFASKQSVTSRTWFQPCCGHCWTRIAGRKVWTREQILEWLSVTDENLEDYAKKLQIDISPFFRDGKTVYRGKDD